MPYKPSKPSKSPDRRKVIRHHLNDAHIRTSFKLPKRKPSQMAMKSGESWRASNRANVNQAEYIYTRHKKETTRARNKAAASKTSGTRASGAAKSKTTAATKRTTKKK